ncbi:MAG TPA: hypothetical protein VFX59_08215 [Polyangiales bacterium]|nr:hypothetical protein [Polyangiales bacterium]
MPSYMGVLEAPEVAALVALIQSLRGRASADGDAMPLPADSAASLPSEPDVHEPASSSPENTP